MIESLMLISLMAMTYFLFSMQFFRFSSKINDIKVSRGIQFILFIIVYVWFIIASLLELPLVINWLVFLLILGVEVHFVFKYQFLVAYALSMFCTIAGLATNIFFRSLISIVTNIPLNSFDKTMNSLKVYPIFFGFIAMVLLLFFLQFIKFPSKLRSLFQRRKSLLFYIWIEIFIYLFLIVQLLLYIQSDNSLGVKLWGIKSSAFSIVVLVITIIYALRVASLEYYMEKQHEIKTLLIQEKEDINKFWELAYTDILTGCANRNLLDKRLTEYEGYGGNITLGFIDVNGLKAVNDQFGHVEGDVYLIKVVDTLSKVIQNYNIDLFRYGGDEFVILSNALDEQKMIQFLNEVNALLKEEKQNSYNCSISFGVAHGESVHYQKLIKNADEAMYRYKMKYYHRLSR